MNENPKFSENLPLLLRSRAGDRLATEELIRLNGGLVAGIALRFCGRGTLSVQNMPMRRFPAGLTRLTMQHIKNLVFRFMLL